MNQVASKPFAPVRVLNWRHWQVSALRIMRWPRIGWTCNFSLSLANRPSVDRLYLGVDLVWFHGHIQYVNQMYPIEAAPPSAAPGQATNSAKGKRRVSDERTTMSNCTHRWRRVHEQAVFGGSFLTGWECVDCGRSVSNDGITPAGLGGVVLEKAARLVGPHGGYGSRADGRRFKEQIIDERGNLTVTE